MIGPNAPSRNQNTTAQLCLFTWAESLPTTFPEPSDFPHNSSLVDRTHRLTGWSPARCRAVIEANGGRVCV